MEYSGAEIIIKMLEKFGIEIIAGIPGGSNLPIYDALSRSRIKHILARHEQGAGYIAHGMARTTGKTAVCLATSGPGVTNLLTAIADAKLDSIPVIAITGQVSTDLLGTDAFQEVDTYGLTMPITKHNYLVRDIKELIKVIPEAFRIAGSGRPGPVVIDVPKDIQTARMNIEKLPEQEVKDNCAQIDETELKNIAEDINMSRKPVLYIGGGIINAGACKVLHDFASKNSIPVASSLMGLGAFPPDESLYLGLIGMHGQKYTNTIINEADLVFACGARFDDRATGNIKNFCPEAKVIHIDIDRSEINKNRKTHRSITCDIKEALEQMMPFIDSMERKGWLKHIEETKKRCSSPGRGSRALNPLNIIRAINMFAERDSIITTDVGQHQMWVAQAYKFHSPRTFITSGGLGTMGFGLPAAIGAALANPGKQVICISGDGSFFMNIQELATLCDLNLNVKIFLMNNGHLGLVRQQQEMFYGKNYFASRFESSADFSAISKGFGIESACLPEEGDFTRIIREAMSVKGPCLINIPVDSSENVTPIVPPGKAIYEMIEG